MKQQINADIVQQIVDTIRSKKEKLCLELLVSKNKMASLAASRIGGLPYWEEGWEIPVNPDGKALTLLLQVNLSDIPETFERGALPKRGLLQIFVDSDDLYGMNLEDITKPESFRVLLHAFGRQALPEAKIREYGFTPSSEKVDADDGFLPVWHEEAVEIRESKAFINFSDHRFRKLFDEEAERMCGKCETAEDWFGEACSNDNLWKIIESCTDDRMTMFGYPDYIQDDPAGWDEYKGYETCLFHSGSNDDALVWGLYGMGNFLMRKQDLENLDFSRVLYDWDN